MAAKKATTVKCRFARCSCLHDSTEIPRELAVKGDGKAYYHSDCLFAKERVAELKQYFVDYVNPKLPGVMHGALLNALYDAVLVDGYEYDYVDFCLHYFAAQKPGALQYPSGLAIALSNIEVKNAWVKQLIRKKKEAEAAMTTPSELFENDGDTPFTYVVMKTPGFEDILQ